MPSRAFIGTCLAMLLWAIPAARAETSVPIDLQVELVRKLVRFERGFVGRASTAVMVVVAVRPSNSASVHAAAQLQEALERARELAGKPIKVSKHSYSTAADLRQASDGAHIVFLTPGLDAELAAIAKSFTNFPAITVTTEGDLVARGAVLGFELVASKPKITLNLGQARRQTLDFSSELFRLANVIQ